MKKSLMVLSIFLVMTILPGCASISLQDTWKAPGVSATQYRKLLVVGLADKPQMRQVFEEVFAGEISKKGATGIASYSLTGVNDKPSRDTLKNIVVKSGADSIITTRLVAMKQAKDTRTGFIMTDRGYTNGAYAGDGVYPTNLYDFYGGSVSYATFTHAPVDVTTSTKVTIETNLFDAETSRLIWSGTSVAVNPTGIIKISTDLADSIVKAMARDGLL